MSDQVITVRCENFFGLVGDAAWAAGVHRGRKPSIDQGQVEQLKAAGLGATEIAKRLKIGRASVYRVLAS